MANGVSGTRSGSGISAAKVTELENFHQEFLDSMKAAKGQYTLWEEGAESGARAILSDLVGKNYSVSGYQLKQTGTYDPVSVKEIEKNLDRAIQGYQNRVHDQWSDGYYAQAVRMLEKATGNNYSVSGYRLKKVKK